MINDELKDTKKATLGDYVTFYNGLKGMNSTNFSCENSNAKYIQFKNIHESKILKDNLGDVYVEELDKQNNVLKGDLLLTGSSENIEEVGTTNINTLSMDNLFVNSFSYIMRPVDINPLYLHYLLKSPNSRKQIMLAGQGITRINLSPSRISNMKISVHDKNTQNNIATLLSSIDDLIQQSMDLENLYSLKKKSYMQKIFSKDPNLRLKGFNDNWKRKQLSELVSYTQPTKFLVKEVTSSGTIPILTPNKSFLIGYTDNTDIAYKAKNNPVIIFDDFTTDHKYVDFDFTMKSSATKILTSKGVDIRFFDYLFESIDYKPESHRRHWIEIFSNFDISIPSSEETKKITKFLSSIDELISAEREQRKQYELVKKYYLNIIFK